jgi:hypothetical protein
MKIHFYSGNTLELSEKEGKAFWGRASTGGLRYWKSREQKVTIFFNSPTIEYIENDDSHMMTVGDIEIQENADKAEALKLKREAKESDTRSEIELKADVLKKMEDEFMDRANCTHEKDGETLRKLVYTDTTNGKRYFPVCAFCGHRERYVGLSKIEKGDSKWTMDDVDTAQPYEG